MGSVIAFPAKPVTETARTPAGRNDPYYHFLENVMTTASACGFAIPQTQDSAVDRVYRKTRHASRLAQLMRGAR